MDDGVRLLWDLAIILSGVALHCYLAYFKAGKLAVSTVKRWFLSEEGQMQLVTYLNDALDRKDKNGKSMADRLGELLLEKVLTWAESPQAAAVADRVTEKIVDKIKKWAGGKMTGMGNQAKSGIAGAELDIGAMIKQAIMQRVMGAPVVQQFLNPAQAPPPG